MRKTRRTGRAAICLLLTMTILVGLTTLQAGATAADEQEKELLGTLSKKYEASSPGTISSGSGDAGGKSYGSYQFSSGSDIPKKFFEWCQASDDTYYQSIGDRLSEAYYDGGAGYGTNFDAAWKALAKENAAGFEQAQRNYVRLRYYDPIVTRVEKDFPGFDMDNYSIALRNVLWSRAVQLGVGGAASMMEYAMNILGGFANQPEAEIIRAIYADCAEVRDPKNDKEDVMSGTTAAKYGVEGKVLSWFSGSSGDVQLGVYIRLAVNEPAMAQQMLATYGYVDAPLDEGNYQFSPVGNTKLALMSSGTTPTLNTLSESENQQFRLTYYASGYYTITNESTGQRLTAAEDGSVTFAAPSTSNAQMWKIVSLDSGFTVQNRSTGQYLSTDADAAGSTIITAADAYQWQLFKGGAAWSLTGASYPTYASTLYEGSSSFPFMGTLRCSYPIQSVKVQVLNISGADAFTPATASGINANLYDLSKLDSKVAFSKLSAGAYTMVITAKSSAASGGTFRLESPFYVSDGDYMVYLDPCGGTVKKTTLQLAAGQAYGDLPEATKSGYRFTGWYTAADGGEEITSSSIVPAANITLYAHYEKLMSYAFLNHDGTTFASGELLPGEAIPLPASKPVRAADESYYYTFSGWDGYTEGMTISADVVFQAQFEAHAHELLPEISTDIYRIKDSFLRGIALGTSVTDLQKNLVPSNFIIIHKGTSTSTKVVGTGMTVEYSVDGQQIQTLTVVVTGDVNGDGKISGTDIVQLRAHLLGKRELNEVSMQAADLSGDGKVSGTDIVQLRAYLLGKHTIKPN